MISDSEMPLFYLERLLFFVCFAYMYICMYAGSTVWSVSLVLGTVLMWTRGRHCVFSIIYIKTWTFCHISTVANQTQHTMLCCYLEFYSLFPNCLKSKADMVWKAVINQSDGCSSSSAVLWCGPGFCAAARSLCYSGKAHFCWSPLCLWKKCFLMSHQSLHEIHFTVKLLSSAQKKKVQWTGPRFSEAHGRNDNVL